MKNLAQKSELPPQEAAFDHNIMLCSEMKEELHDCHSESWQPVKSVISEENIKTEFVDLVHGDMQMIKSTKDSTSEYLAYWNCEEREEYETNIKCENGIDRKHIISEVVDVKTEQPDNLAVINNRNEDRHLFNVDKKVEMLTRQSDNLNEKLWTVCKEEEEAATEMGVSQMKSSNTPHCDHMSPMANSDSVQEVLKQETDGSETSSENNQRVDLPPLGDRQKVYYEDNSAKEMGLQIMQTADKSSWERTTNVGEGSLANTSEIVHCDMCHQAFSDPAYMLKHVGWVHHHGNLEKQKSSNTPERKDSLLQRESNTPLSRNNGMNYSIPIVSLCKLKVQPLEMVNVNLNCIPICPLGENHLTEHQAFSDPANTLKHVGRVHHRGNLEKHKSSNTPKRKDSFLQRESNTPLSRNNGMNYSIPIVSLCKLKVQPLETVNVNLNCIPICPVGKNLLTEQNSRQQVAQDCNVSSIHAIRQFQSIPACSRTFVKDNNKYKNSDLERRQVCAVECDKKIYTVGKSYKSDVCSVGFVLTDHVTVQKRKHTVRKRHVCGVCGVDYARKYHLQRHIRKHTGEKPYMCDVCGVRFSEPSILKVHKRKHTGEKPYKCDICGVNFAYSSTFRCHKKKHTGEKPYKCDVCGVCFTSHSGLDYHKMKHTGQKPYMCDVCGANFSYSSAFVHHKMKHTGEKPYNCDVCGGNFASSSRLRCHKRKHSGEKPYKCDICSVSFSQHSSLQCHRRKHAGEKPHKCDICGVCFSQPSYLQCHRRKHTGEKPYKCDVCGANFAYPSNLLYHRRKHTGEKPYKCDVCGANFAYSSDLQCHQRKHTGEKPYKCDVCTGRFSQNSSLRCHKRKHTGEKPYKCDVCTARFSQNSNLRCHKRKHTGEKHYKCDICCGNFASSSSLRCHRRKHTGEKPYKCDICGENFAYISVLQYHKRKHTGEKPYKCDICCGNFASSSSLRCHRRKHTGEKPYKCDICGANFASSSGLRYHKRKHTGEKPYKCDVCGANFAGSFGLRYHKKNLHRRETLQV